MPCEMRVAREADIDQMHAIYAPIVRETIISFEHVPPDLESFRQRVMAGCPRFPWLVCDHDGEVLGYTYATSYRTRPAYQWSVESSVYGKGSARGMGVGRGLYASLFGVLRLLGYYNVYAGIALPNHASVALHVACGFTEIGVFKAAGFKLGAWHDVGWWQLRLADLPTDPTPPLAMADCRTEGALQQALIGGTSFIRA